MALLGTRRRSLGKNGIARRKRLLDSARTLLETRELDEISLGDVAAHAAVPKGSAYHFYGDIKDLYCSLLAVIEEELAAALTVPVRRKVRSWQHVIEIINERGALFYTANRAARQLAIGPKTPADLKFRDRQHDVMLSKIFEHHVETFFELPEFPERSKVFFRALEIADLMFCLSVLESGKITTDMRDEAARAMNAYLQSYLPRKLPMRKRGSIV